MCGMEDTMSLPSPFEVPPEMRPPPVAENFAERHAARLEEKAEASPTACHLEHIFVPLSMVPPAKLDRCALVGSSGDMVGKRFGQEIDAHDAVIRVNRLPTPEYVADFGKRTDVLFTAAKQDGIDQYNFWGQNYRKFGGRLQLCPWQGACPFHTIVLKGADRYECGRDFEEKYPPKWPGWRPTYSPHAVVHQRERLNELAYRLLNFTRNRMRPTNGFQAFLTFAFGCRQLDVYGFSGQGSADKHYQKAVHDLELEHVVMHSMLEGGLTKAVARIWPTYASCIGQKKHGWVNVRKM